MRRSGFTLVELSIVLVVIGLIIGGILAGQAAIRQSEISSYGADLGKVQTAINNFRQKYGQWPGDFSQASQYWSGTSNGNNNNAVETTPEYWAFWQHLGLANMWAGQFTGALVPNGTGPCTNAGGCMVPGMNIAAASANSQTGYWVWKWSSVWFNRVTNGVWVGNFINNPQVQGPSFSGIEARAIDSKLDDGNGSSGKIMGLVSTGPAINCLGPVLTAAIAATAAPGSYDYYTMDDTLRCRVIQWLD